MAVIFGLLPPNYTFHCLSRYRVVKRNRAEVLPVKVVAPAEY